MTKRKTHRQQELQELRDWCLIIIRFKAELWPHKHWNELEENVNLAFDDGDLRGLRECANERSEDARDLSASQQRKLNERLHARFGRGLAESAAAVRREVDSILRRGMIISEDEYRLLKDYISNVCEDPSPAKQRRIEQIDALITAYGD